MNTLWYDTITQKINSNLDKAIFVRDLNNLFSNLALLDFFEERHIEIFVFSNDLILRRKLLSSNKVIILCQDEKKLPYDLLNKFPIIEISLKDIFPTLDVASFDSVDIEKIDLIFEDYIKSERKYIKKSYSETEDYLDLVSLKAVKEEPANNKVERLETLIDSLKMYIKGDKRDLQYFHTCSSLVGEIYYLGAIEDYKIGIAKETDIIDEQFKEYIFNNFNNLGYMHDFSMSPLNSNILSSIDFKKNTAIICLDCMSFAEWFVLKNHLEKFDVTNIEEKFSLAIIPSITKYSRMAIFEGKNPLISEAKSEEKAFKEYIQSKGQNPNASLFKNLRDVNINYYGYDNVALIYTFIDDIVHGSTNKKMTILSTQDTLETLEIGKLISTLLNAGYTIYLTSDHGNVYCQSNGINIPKQMVDEKDTRVAIYSKQNLAEELNWDSKICLNLPTIMGNDKYIVTDSKRKNFGNRTEGLSHGGISFEEVIVPFIKIGGNK